MIDKYSSIIPWRAICDDKIPIVDLGTRQLKGLDGHVRVYNVKTRGIGPDFAPNANDVAAQG